jgi:heterodisulfide reductase subunit B
LKLAFYPGCLVLQRMPEYELATRAVLRRLGIELEIVQEATCCGAPIVESYTADWVYLATYNLARVSDMGHDTVVTLCGSCTNALTRARRALQDPNVRAETERRLAPLGLSAAQSAAHAVQVKHLLRLLGEREQALRRHIVRSLSLRVAYTNPCQVFRPGAVMGFDDPAAPRAMRRLIDLTGVEVVEYGGEDECCGSAIYLADSEVALAAGRRKLEMTQEADVLIHACGNCHLLLRNFQPTIIGDETRLRKRAVFLPQLIGLAMGLTEAELGLREGLWQ